tara:strand:+ start:243 stop:872 length:630 start_codon:yes stop_codon:yes gene_type:complete
MNIKLLICAMVMIIFHVVGLVFISSDLSHSIVQLSWLNLCITAICVFVNKKDWNKPFVLFAIVAFMIGFFLEVLGVQTAWVFGAYEYGNPLGFKLWGVPLTIGLNWFILCYGACELSRLLVKDNFWLLVLLSSALMVGIDLLIEPVAIGLGFWSWQNVEPPLQNFIAWFAIAVLLNVLYLKYIKSDDNRMAPISFVVQVVFFVILGISI